MSHFFRKCKISPHLNQNHGCFRLICVSSSKEIESAENIDLRKIIGIGCIKNWRHRKIFLAVIIKAIFHQDKLRWLQLALTGSPLATASDQGSGHHKRSHTWETIVESDAMAGTQPLRSVAKGTNAQGALHRGKRSWARNMRYCVFQICWLMPEVLFIHSSSQQAAALGESNVSIGQKF